LGIDVNDLKLRLPGFGKLPAPPQPPANKAVETGA
jgi:hypothetical protein